MDTSKGYSKASTDHGIEHQSPTHIKTVHARAPHSLGLRDSIDDSPPASPSSSTSSKSDETSHVAQVRDKDLNPVSPDPTHPLQDSEYNRRNYRVPRQINTAHPKNNDTYRPPPITPGEDKTTFDQGMLHAGRPSPPRSNGFNSGVVSAPLPTLPPAMNRNHSYPEPGRPYPQDHYANRPQSHHPTSEMRSAPIYLTPGHQQQGQSKPSRTPSPNQSTRTLKSYNTTLNGSQQNLPNHTSSNSLHRQYNGRPFTPPAALRPDSVCSFPDNSPLLAPNVLAAVDARLRAAAANQNNANGSGGNIHGLQSPPSRSNLRFAGSGSGTNSRASSIGGPVITHHSVMQNSEAIMSREQLFDVLNKDGDENGNDTDNDTRYGSNFSLGKPKPEFFRSSSAQSSRRNSTSSSAFANSDIELNARSGPGNNKRPGMTVLAGAGASRLGSRTGSGFEKSGLHGSFDGQSVKVEKSAWLKSKNKTYRRWRGLCCVIGLLAFAAAVTGITLGFMSGKGKVDGLAPPPDPENPKPIKPTPPITEFTPDPNLRKAFYGVVYNPAKSLMPWCGATLQAVIDDIILMSQITNRIRIYGMDCNQAALVFEAIKLLKVPMQVVLTIWVDKDPVTYQRQYDTLLSVLDQYGTDMLTGVSVGNEVLFRKDQTLDTLGTMMKNVRTALKTRYNKDILVFTSDVGSNMKADLASVSDMLQGNLHPYFSGTAAANAANWTMNEYRDKMEGNPVSSGHKGVISEVGWPTAPATAVYPANSVPGLENLQTLVDGFVCQANTAGVPYYWFEFKDEPWKQDPTVPVEPYWGIFDKDGKLKIKIPDCIAP
ncbi:hypothetical protein BG006_001336 [Podila minutissima]|uniref:glucan endo-1,3-beta-D-glucosidase n=1 Tax=Podila minutissima TaxID=64525 RepID=A0A9P5ST77_9FUNG|nr:hypothetical protein BG006_001336 [Podila minutissima]